MDERLESLKRAVRKAPDDAAAAVRLAAALARLGDADPRARALRAAAAVPFLIPLIASRAPANIAKAALLAQLFADEGDAA